MIHAAFGRPAGLLFLAGCGRPGGVMANLTDTSIQVAPNMVTSGDITFHIKNTSATTVHEFAIVQTDLSPEQLSMDADGNVAEDKLSSPGEMGWYQIGNEASTWTVAPDGKVYEGMLTEGVTHAHRATGMDTGWMSALITEALRAARERPWITPGALWCAGVNARAVPAMESSIHLWWLCCFRYPRRHLGDCPDGWNSRWYHRPRRSSHC
jgi:hypothetical protein